MPNKHRCKHPDCCLFGGRDGYCKNHRPMAKGRTHLVGKEYFGYGFHKGEWTPEDYGVLKDKYGYEEW